ncbi:PREDICTED: UPF0669 protein C6orf120 homolog [Priapulus caudatus]|uniref:UPF0669 protein C6orf120 homolog n=1 Tax=Priapulus caudatus TaxID=37621 RepID=A0ABM1DTL9_PRICU|nr:PREDICTED: UPF0669 protein C6orf120 homolog [Priapulus caudatus]
MRVHAIIAALLACLATCVRLSVATGDLVQRLQDVVAAGNYTYFRLNRAGSVTMVLRSMRGDADLYVSESTLRPDFAFENHDLQSVTCGLDSVTIPAAFRRPVGVGVYGHPHHMESEYSLEIYLSDDRSEPEYERAERDNEAGFAAATPKLPLPDMPAYGESHEEESLLWTIIVGVLKVLFDVLL